MSHWFLKVRQPLAHQRQALSLNAIDTHPALPLVLDEASGFKHLNMPSRRLPGMREDLSWNFQRHLACPANLLGAIDLFQAPHHAVRDDVLPQLMWAMPPRWR
jgi:hypothetical protein